MHESAALLLCRSAFVALGFLPLAFALFWATLEFIPAYRHARAASWEAELTARIGVSVEIESVSLVAPSRYVLSNVVARHPETQLLIAQVPKAMVAQVGKQWFVRCESGEVSTAGATQLWNTTHDWVLCRPGQLPGEVAVAFDKFVFKNGGESTEFGASRIILLPDEKEQRLQVTLAPVVASDDAVQPTTIKPAVVTVSRQVERGSPQTSVRIDSGTASLPCSLAFGVVPSLRRLGDEARFHGSARVLRMHSGWMLHLNPPPEGDVQTAPIQQPNATMTALSNVDFGRLTDGTEARIRGIGTLAFSEALIADIGIEKASGTVYIGSEHNAISAAFLKHACNSLGLNFKANYINSLTTGTEQPFSQLILKFRMASGRLQLQGDYPSGIVLVDPHNGTLVACRQLNWEQGIPIQSVVQTLELAASETPQSSPELQERRMSRLARTWLPSYNVRTASTQDDMPSRR